MLFNQYADQLVDILELSRLPVAVKFLDSCSEIPSDYRTDLYLTYCQALMMAQKGEKIAVVADNIACANGAAALGLRSVTEKLSKGEMTYRLGVFSDPVYGARLSDVTPRIPQGRYGAILLCPLREAVSEPQIIIIQGLPYSLMWLLMANNYSRGCRYSLSTAVSQGICVDVTVVPLLTGEMNLSLGCYGSRNATDEDKNEAVAGFPFSELPTIAETLPLMREKVMERTVKKKAFNRLAESLGWNQE